MLENRRFKCRCACFVVVCGLVAVGQDVSGDEVVHISAALRTRHRLSAFYTKTVDADGIAITASDKPENAALMEAKYIIVNMLQAAPRLAKALVDAGLRVTVMASDEFTTDIPEHSRLKPKEYWDRRARGLGGSKENPVVSCGEENLLRYPGDPYETESILVHEFAHSVHEVGMAEIGSTFDAALRRAYESAKQAGLWEGTYAMTDHKEYFAEGTQSWFDCNAPRGKVHGDIRTREALQKYDPGLAKLLADVYGDNTWRYTPPTRRSARNKAGGYTWPENKRFAWPAEQQGDSTNSKK